MRLVVCDKKTNKWAILITLALIIQISNRISVHLLPFLLRAQAVLRRHNYWFLAGKSRSHVAARLTRKYWVPNFRHFVTINPSPPLFATICHYSPLFATIRHYSPLFVLFVLFAIRYSRLFAVRCSLFATIRYSLFGFSRHPTITTFALAWFRFLFANTCRSVWSQVSITCLISKKAAVKPVNVAKVLPVSTL